MSASRGVVVLVHGLFRSRYSLRALHGTLRKAHFVPLDYAYPSTQRTAVEHGQAFREELLRLDRDPAVDVISVVTHSLGGIITRAALAHDVPTKLHRIVMLAPPNRGSSRATFWAPLVGNLIRPLDDLRDDRREGLLAIPLPSDLEVGVIAGSRDTTVAVAQTHLDGQTDHLTIPAGHTFIMYYPAVKDQVVTFLRQGRFARHPSAQGSTA